MEAATRPHHRQRGVDSRRGGPPHRLLESTGQRLPAHLRRDDGHRGHQDRGGHLDPSIPERAAVERGVLGRLLPQMMRLTDWAPWGPVLHLPTAVNLMNFFSIPF